MFLFIFSAGIAGFLNSHSLAVADTVRILNPDNKKAVCRAHVSKGPFPHKSKLLALAPCERKFLIGLLAQKSNGEYVFGIAPYLGIGHENVLNAIETLHRNIQTEPELQVLWGGEIEIVGTKKSAQAVTFNEMSGFVAAMMAMNPNVYKNSVAVLKRILRRTMPSFLGTSAQFHSYKTNPKFLLEEMGLFPSGLRHEFGNLASGLSIILSKPDSSIPIDGKALERLDLYLLGIQIYRAEINLTSEEVQKLDLLESDLLKIKEARNWAPILSNKENFFNRLMWASRLATSAEIQEVEITVLGR